MSLRESCPSDRGRQSKLSMVGLGTSEESSCSVFVTEKGIGGSHKNPSMPQR